MIVNFGAENKKHNVDKLVSLKLSHCKDVNEQLHKYQLTSGISMSYVEHGNSRELMVFEYLHRVSKLAFVFFTGLSKCTSDHNFGVVLIVK